MKITGEFIFTKRTAGKIVQVEHSQNMYLTAGQTYILNHFFRDTQNITKFYLGLIRSTGGLLNVRWQDSATNRNWIEENAAILGDRQEWLPDLTLWPSLIQNAVSPAQWVIGPAAVGSVFVRGAFLTSNNATPYVTPNSSNTGREAPLAASLTLNAIELDKNDTLDVEYAVTLV